jgi:hypothetical protein
VHLGYKVQQFRDAHSYSVSSSCLLSYSSNVEALGCIFIVAACIEAEQSKV